MAKTKTYKDVRQGRYESRGMGEYMVGPHDNTHGWDMQNAPAKGGDQTPDQFGRKDSKSEAD